MINPKRVRRIKNAIYIFMIVLFFLPLILVLVMCVRMFSLFRDIDDSLQNASATMENAAVAFDRAIMSYRVPNVHLPDFPLADGDNTPADSVVITLPENSAGELSYTQFPATGDGSVHSGFAGESVGDYSPPLTGR